MGAKVTSPAPHCTALHCTALHCVPHASDHRTGRISIRYYLKLNIIKIIETIINYTITVSRLTIVVKCPCFCHPFNEATACLDEGHHEMFRPNVGLKSRRVLPDFTPTKGSCGIREATMEPPWGHHEATMGPPWGHHGATVGPPWGHRGASALSRTSQGDQG
jgi:hypothetical protein